MRRVSLNPIYHYEGYSVLLEHEIMSYLGEVLFDPLTGLVAEVRNNEAPNDREHSAVWDALVAGTIWYSEPLFMGAFNSAISRELRAMGARKMSAGFLLKREELPIVLRGVISATTLRHVELHRDILSTLDRMQEHMEQASTGIEIEKKVAAPIVADLQKQLVQTTREVKDIEIKVAPVPPQMPKQLAENITEPTNRAIRGLAQEAVQRLRDKVKENVTLGARPDRLADIIESEFGIAKRRARFIADQETSQLVSDFRKDRYTALGSKRYTWTTSGDEKVRPTHGESNNHRVLNGREFAWDSPPVVDTATCRRCHPGEDFGPCRCVARAILTFA